jgi:shikimate kinase
VVRVLVTGMSGAGKSTLVRELCRRGYLGIDTDYDGWVLPDGRWDEERMSAFLDSNPTVVVSGVVENQSSFYDRFEHIVFLEAPLGVLLERVRQRTDNPYGRSEEQRSEIKEYFESVRPLLRRGSTIELDSTQSTAELADTVERLIVYTH